MDIPISCVSLTNRLICSPTAAWAAAVSRAKVELGDDYQKFLGTRDYESCFKDLTAEQNQFSKKWPRVKRIIGPFLDLLRSFDRAISTCVSSHPEIAALVWGGVQALLTVGCPHKMDNG